MIEDTLATAMRTLEPFTYTHRMMLGDRQTERVFECFGEVFADALQLFFSLTEAMTTGMTAAAVAAGHHQENAELTAFACLMMIERVNFIMTTEVELPEEMMCDKIADIMFAAFGLVVP